MFCSATSKSCRVRLSALQLNHLCVLRFCCKTFSLLLFNPTQFHGKKMQPILAKIILLAALYYRRGLQCCTQVTASAQYSSGSKHPFCFQTLRHGTDCEGLVFKFDVRYGCHVGCISETSFSIFLYCSIKQSSPEVPLGK